MHASTRKGRGVFTLRPRPPLAADLTLDRYRRWGVDPATVYAGGILTRVARIGAGLVPFRLAVAGAPEEPRVTVAFAGADTPAVRAALRREVECLLGTAWDLPGFYARAAHDPVLAPLVSPLRGLRPPRAPDLFEMLVGAISAQQVNLTFAYTTRARLVRHFGTPVHFDGVTVYAFPEPAVLARAEVAVLRAMQFSTRKAEYIVGLARELAAGRLDLASLAAASEADVIARLTAIRGLGRWTAEWFLARGLGRPDVCPADDLGVRRAVEAFCFRGRPADPARVRMRARVWRPYRTLAVHYLLAGLRLPRPDIAPVTRAQAAGGA